MPSKAFRDFRVHAVTVRRLIEAHGTLTENNRGKKALSHITRSGIVMLCACWEEYAESLLKQSLDYIAHGIASAQDLPIETRKFISLKIKEDKNELSPFLLTGEAWISTLQQFCETDIERLHTPKSGNLNKLYKRYIGIREFTSTWTSSSQDIDDFVTLRGGIAHRGKGDYIKCPTLQNHLNSIYSNCIAIDGAMCDYLHDFIGGTVQPWRKATR